MPLAIFWLTKCIYLNAAVPLIACTWMQSLLVLKEAWTWMQCLFMLKEACIWMQSLLVLKEAWTWMQSLLVLKEAWTWMQCLFMLKEACIWMQFLLMLKRWGHKVEILSLILKRIDHSTPVSQSRHTLRFQPIACHSIMRCPRVLTRPEMVWQAFVPYIASGQLAVFDMAEKTTTGKRNLWPV